MNPYFLNFKLLMTIFFNLFNLNFISDILLCFIKLVIFTKN